MACTPRAAYEAACERLHCHANTDLVLSLPLSGEAVAHTLTLDLSRNYVGRKGIVPLLRALQCYRSLRYLNISDNYLDNESVGALVAALRGGLLPDLAALDLSRNPISNPGGKLLSRLADERPALRSIGVRGTLMNRALATIIESKAGHPLPSTAAAAPTPATAVHAPMPAAGRLDSLRALSEVSAKARAPTADAASAVPSPLGTRADWSAMETIWRLAAVAAPPEDGWSGLASVMAVVRRDNSIATSY